MSGSTEEEQFLIYYPVFFIEAEMPDIVTIIASKSIFLSLSDSFYNKIYS